MPSASALARPASPCCRSQLPGQTARDSDAAQRSRPGRTRGDQRHTVPLWQLETGACGKRSHREIPGEMTANFHRATWPEPESPENRTADMTPVWIWQLSNYTDK